MNGGPLRYIQTAGNAGDGGLTKVFSSLASFVYPVGAPTLVPVRPLKYTPATIGITSAPTTYGSITVVPVGYEHPATTVNGQSLTYFWRVESSGFTGLAAGSITHNFVYSQTDVVGTEVNYIPSFYNRTTSTWNNGTTANINTGTNTITDWAGSSNIIDADFTAGDASFGTPKIYYSRQSGIWSVPATWSLTSHTVNNVPATPPGANDIVLIGNNNVITLYNNAAYPLNTATVSCASLQIDAGSVLDIGNNPGSVFSMVVNSPLGNGKFRLTATKAVAGAPNYDVSTFAFPVNSDFSDFNVNLGTTEFYTTTTDGNALYILPSVGLFGNLLLSPLGNDNLALPNRSLVTIYGDLTLNGTTGNSATGLSWNTNNGYYNNSNFYPTVEKTIHVQGNMNVNGGSLLFWDDIVPQHLVVDKDVNVSAANGACILVWDASYGATPYNSGPTVNNTFVIGGNLNNNGTTNGKFSGLNLVTTNATIHYCDLTFQGSGNTVITGTGINNFHNVIVNKGSSQSTTLTLNSTGTLTTPVDNWLTLQNGTFIYGRTNPSSDFTISTITPFSIPATAGLNINLPSNTGNRNILIGNASNDNGDLLLSGKLTIINGNVYVGSTSGNNNNNNDIEYTSSGASAIDIRGGKLNVNGQIRTRSI